MLYNQPFDQPTNPNAPYIDGNPAAGIQGSIVPAEAIEFDQREVVEVITRANARNYVDFSGMPCAAPINGDLQQLRKAIEGFIRAWQFIIDTTITYRVHGVGADFPDFNQAMSYLRVYYITTNGHVILQSNGSPIGSGVATQYIYNGGIYFGHKNNNRISVFGAPMLSTCPHDLAYYACNNSSPGQRQADTITNLAMLRTKFATELHLVIGSVYVGNGVPNLMHFDGFLLTGDGSNASGFVTIASYGFSNLDTYMGLAIVGFGGQGMIYELGCSAGFEGPGPGTAQYMPLIVCGCGNVQNSGGLALGDGSYITMTGAYIGICNGGDGFTVWPRTGCQMDGPVHVAANSYNGVHMYLSSTCYIYAANNYQGAVYDYSHFYRNGQWGAAVTHGFMDAYADCSGNAAGSIYAAGGSSVGMTAGDAGISGVCSPPWSTVGNANALIY